MEAILILGVYFKRTFYILHINCPKAEDEERIRRKESLWAAITPTSPQSNNTNNIEDSGRK